jgi:CHAD domain-containing protein
VAATLAATVAVGVGVALARAERDRRWVRATGEPDGGLTPSPQEPLADGLRRIALEQLDSAIGLLESDAEAIPAGRAVHETRKCLKRLRALVRLLREELGDKEYARDNAVLRDAGLRLAVARDAEVIVGTLDGLIERHPKKLGRRGAIVRLRGQLVAERDAATEDARYDSLARAEVVEELRALRGRVLEWKLPRREGIGTVEPGLRTIYRQGARRRRRAMRAKNDTGRAMHQWRKRVKDLRYAAAMLDHRHPPRGPRSGPQTGHARIRRLARRADELGELLGEEHDLGLLSERLEAGRRRGDGPRLEVGGRTRAILLKTIARRRKRLRREAIRKGERLYRRTPKRFVRRVGDSYARSSRV